MKNKINNFFKRTLFEVEASEIEKFMPREEK